MEITIDLAFLDGFTVSSKASGLLFQACLWNENNWKTLLVRGDQKKGSHDSNSAIRNYLPLH
jgi:hypothetical protein